MPRYLISFDHGAMEHIPDEGPRRRRRRARGDPGGTGCRGMGIRGGVYPHDEISPSVVATDGTVTESTENKAYIAGPPPRPRRTACDCRPGTHMPRLSPAELQAARRASGNLGGRPRKPTQAEARAAALEELVPAAIKSLAAHLGEGDPDAWRAALRVFELSYGKPAETVELDVEHVDPLHVGEMTAAERSVLLRGARALPASRAVGSAAASRGHGGGPPLAHD